MKLSEELITAAHESDFEEIRRLRDSGHRLDLLCDEGQDLLFHYIWRNNVGSTNNLHKLLSLGVRPLNLHTHGWTALAPAIWSLDSEWVRLVLDAGADPNIFSCLGDIPEKALDTVLSTYDNCDRDSEEAQLNIIEKLIRDAGGTQYLRGDPLPEIQSK